MLQYIITKHRDRGLLSMISDNCSMCTVPVGRQQSSLTSQQRLSLCDLFVFGVQLPDALDERSQQRHPAPLGPQLLLTAPLLHRTVVHYCQTFTVLCLHPLQVLLQRPAGKQLIHRQQPGPQPRGTGVNSSCTAASVVMKSNNLAEEVWWFSNRMCQPIEDTLTSCEKEGHSSSESHRMSWFNPGWTWPSGKRVIHQLYFNEISYSVRFTLQKSKKHNKWKRETHRNRCKLACCYWTVDFNIRLGLNTSLTVSRHLMRPSGQITNCRSPLSRVSCHRKHRCD